MTLLEPALRTERELDDWRLRVGRALPGATRPTVARITLDAPTSGRARSLPI